MKTFALIVVLCILVSGCPGKNIQRKGGDKPAAREAAEATKLAEENTGLPLRLLLPEGAHGEEELDLLKPNLGPGTVSWSTQFTYDKGFDAAVKSFDEQLAAQEFVRLVGPNVDQDVQFNPDSTAKPTSARGRKAWLSEDRHILIFMAYVFRRGEKDAADQEMYQLSVLKSEKPNEVKAPNKVAPIK